MEFWLVGWLVGWLVDVVGFVYSLLALYWFFTPQYSGFFIQMDGRGASLGQDGFERSSVLCPVNDSVHRVRVWV